MRKIFLLVVSFFLLASVRSQSPWPATKNTAKPLTRWWWMGNAVDGKNINSLLSEYSKIGIGGVEVVPIYGAKGFEHRYINYLSPQWLRVLDTTIAAAKKYDMLVDISIGSGWPIGGPDVSLKDAATKMEAQQYKVSAGGRISQKIKIANPKLQNNKDIFPAAIVAYGENGEMQDVQQFLLEDGTLNWSPQKGDWNVIAIFNSKTMQKVKRAAPGGEGYTLDHFSGDGVNNYINYFDKHFGKNSRGLRSLYNDSYEVFNADWTPDFFDAFKKLRGYDLKSYLPQLIKTKVDDELTGRVKSDYRETMSDLVLNNFTRRMTAWAHSKKTVFLNQAHGSPGNLLDLYAAVDIPETETFGSSVYPIPGLRRDMYDPRVADTEPLMFKFASSAAHVVGHPFTSSETHTWLTEHFKTNLALCKPEAENLFLSGVNQLMFHGTTYSPADVPWPGWLFYASVNFTPANSLWPHLKAYNEFITRCQSVLQAGQPDNEILLYWPVYDLWNQTEGMDLPFRAHNTDVWIHGTDLNERSKELKKAGYSFDYVSDEMIQNAFLSDKEIKIKKEGVGYATVVIPALKLMPEATLKNLITLARAGATVVFNNLPEDVPGLHELEKRRKEFAATLNQVKPLLLNGVAKIGKGKMIVSTDLVSTLPGTGLKGEELVKDGLQFIRRKITGGYYYFVANHTAKETDDWYLLNHNQRNITLLDPQTGNAGAASVRAANGEAKVRLQLKPGESMVIKISDQKTSMPWKYRDKISSQIQLSKNWKLAFVEGGPLLPPARNIGTLQLWTDLKDSVYQDFSGTGRYTTTFNVNKKAGKEYLLQLNELYETARIIVNGKHAGYIYSVPYELRIGKFLKQGANKIEIEVCNLMANRIRYMDRNKMVWRNYHEINFVNKDYKEFDASDWKTMPSGLAGPATILEF